MTKDEAITAVKEVTGMSLPWDDRHYEALQMAIEALRQFADSGKKASAQGQESDLISRQEALDCFHVWIDKHGDIHEPDEMAEYNAIEALPSAQPERTCVNCGRTVNNGGWYADGRTRCPIEEHYALPKDGYCHLWEKGTLRMTIIQKGGKNERLNQQTGGD